MKTRLLLQRKNNPREYWNDSDKKWEAKEFATEYLALDALNGLVSKPLGSVWVEDAISVDDENTECIQRLFELLNYMGNDTRLAGALSNHLNQEHRTLQQSFCRMTQVVLEQYAQADGEDERNQGAKEFARQVALITAPMPYV